MTVEVFEVDADKFNALIESRCGVNITFEEVERKWNKLVETPGISIENAIYGVLTTLVSAEIGLARMERRSGKKDLCGARPAFLETARRGAVAILEELLVNFSQKFGPREEVAFFGLVSEYAKSVEYDDWRKK